MNSTNCPQDEEIKQLKICVWVAKENTHTALICKRFQNTVDASSPSENKTARPSWGWNYDGEKIAGRAEKICAALWTDEAYYCALSKIEI